MSNNNEMYYSTKTQTFSPTKHTLCCRYGHVIINYLCFTQFGEVIATTEHEEATIIAEIDYSLIEQRR